MKRILLCISVLFAVTAVEAQELTIIHLNDTHSHIDPERSGKYKGLGGVVEQAAYVDSVRLVDGKSNVLLLHAGDFSQGSSYFTELGGNIEIDVLNSMKYDVVGIGNHEFDNGIKELSRRLKNLKADVVCANYDFSRTLLGDIIKPYVIVRKAGKKIAVIGLLTDVSKVVDISVVAELEYKDPVPVVNELAGYLRNEKKCDLVICLSHLGYEEDKDLASQIRNVDLIVGGHSHTRLRKIQHVADLDGKDVKIVQNWKWGLNVGNLKVKF